MKRWGKSPPASRVTGMALQTPPGARSDRDVGGPPVKSRVDRTEVDSNVGPRWMIAPKRLLRTESGLQADSQQMESLRGLHLRVVDLFTSRSRGLAAAAGSMHGATWCLVDLRLYRERLWRRPDGTYEQVLAHPVGQVRVAVPWNSGIGRWSASAAVGA